MITHIKDFPSLLPVIAGVVTGGIVIASGGSILQSGVALVATGASGYAASSLVLQGQDIRRKLIEAERDSSRKEVERVRRSLGINGELEALQGKYDLLMQAIGELKDKEQELKERVQRIQQNPPNLEELEQRQQQLAALKTQINESIGQSKAIAATIAEREKQRDGLQEISAQSLQKQEEIRQLELRIGKLNQQAAELELFRNIYDALKQDEENLSAKKLHLQAEIPRLQQECDRILAEIAQSATRAQQVDNLRVEVEKLEAEKRNKLSELASIKRQIEQLNSEKSILEAEIISKNKTIGAQKLELGELEVKIRQAKNDLEEAQSGIKQVFQALEEKVEVKAHQVSAFISEKEFLSGFKRYLATKGLVFPERIVNAFHTSLKVQDISALVILAGISGTGKSELPQAYAEFIGAPLVMLPVQPRWDSPQDLQGFYNYIEKKYKPTPLMQYLYQHGRQNDLKGRMVMVLLDEMNLAKVEYYFSDFLSKLETRRNKETYLEIDAGSLKLGTEQKQVLIPEQFLFVGTMNEDETTQSLSDKVLDRANVLTFGKPPELKLRDGNQAKPATPTEYVTWETFNQVWTKHPSPSSSATASVKYYVDRANVIMDSLGRPFAHRVFQAFAKYVANYPNADQDETIMKLAIADQFGQKLLPKLRGVMVDDSKEQLVTMQSLLTELGDDALNQAFERAMRGQYGQFQWKGMVYQQEQV